MASRPRYRELDSEAVYGALAGSVAAPTTSKPRAKDQRALQRTAALGLTAYCIIPSARVYSKVDMRRIRSWVDMIH